MSHLQNKNCKSKFVFSILISLTISDWFKTLLVQLINWAEGGF